jgi:hypothetical protein
VGLASVGVGCWLIYPPLALIVVGTIFMAAAILIHILDLRRKR